MKKLFIKLFARDKFLGQLAASAASVAAGYLVSLLPSAPEFVTVFARAFLSLPSDVAITQAGVAAALFPAFLVVIQAVVQHYLVSDNNKVLADLTTTGLYSGKLDGHVGPEARAAVDSLITANDLRPQ